MECLPERMSLRREKKVEKLSFTKLHIYVHPFFFLFFSPDEFYFTTDAGVLMMDRNVGSSLTDRMARNKTVNTTTTKKKSSITKKKCWRTKEKTVV